jgi:hypothetical protein
MLSVLANWPVALAKLSDLAGVNHNNGQLRTGQSPGDLPLQPTAGLQHNQRGFNLRQSFDQLFDNGFVVDQTLPLTRWIHRHIQSRLRHVDADNFRTYFQNSILLDSILLQARLILANDAGSIAQATVRALAEAGRDDPCYNTVYYDLGLNDLSRPVSCNLRNYVHKDL